LARPRQYDLELGEKSGLRLDIDAAAVLFHDDVVAHRQAKPGTFAREFGREELVEYFVRSGELSAGPPQAAAAAPIARIAGMDAASAQAARLVPR